MLILKPVNGVWYIVSAEFPGGHWAAFSDPDTALIFQEWLFDSKFDCVGILTRLYAGSLTEADRRVIRFINYASRTGTRVWSQKEPVIYALIRARNAQPL